MKSLLSSALAPLFAALLLAGCVSTPEFTPRSAPEAPVAFKEDGGARFTQVSTTGAQPRGAWWLAFNDAALTDLVTRAADNNTSLQIAAARIAEAQGLLRNARANQLPQVGANAGVQRSTLAPGSGGQPGQAQSIGQAGLAASWEPDFFGKLSMAKDAASLDLQSREALMRNTRLVVQADVAQAYFDLRALDVERALLRETVGAYEDTLRLTERRFQAGDVAELDVVRVKSEVSSTKSQAIALDREREIREHALAVLLGELPEGFKVTEGDWSNVLPRIPADLPGEVLARRPDVVAARLSMEAAQKRAGVARLAWFPDVTLTGNAGFASSELGDVFKWSARSWGIGALMSLPIFDGGRREAGVERANAQWDIAAASYREQVLGAFRDVEDRLSSLRLLSDQEDQQRDAVSASKRATVLSDTRYKNGLVSQLELLDARRKELDDRRKAVQIRSAQHASTVGLIRAIGGSWDTVPESVQAKSEH